MLKKKNLENKLFISKLCQNYVTYITASFIATLMISFQSNDFLGSHFDNMAEALSAQRVTLSTSSCARAFINALKRHIDIRTASGQWKDRYGRRYVFTYQAGNHKSLKVEKLSTLSDNYTEFKKSNGGKNLAQASDRDIDYAATNDVQKAVNAENSTMLNFNATGFYPNGNPCTMSWPFTSYGLTSQ
ncbi:MAG: hypothetical protein ACYTXA_29265 [Nostoc sp.]